MRSILAYYHYLRQSLHILSPRLWYGPNPLVNHWFKKSLSLAEIQRYHSFSRVSTRDQQIDQLIVLVFLRKRSLLTSAVPIDGHGPYCRSWALLIVLETSTSDPHRRARSLSTYALRSSSQTGCSKIGICNYVETRQKEWYRTVVYERLLLRQ